MDASEDGLLLIELHSVGQPVGWEEPCKMQLVPYSAEDLR